MTPFFPFFYFASQRLVQASFLNEKKSQFAKPADRLEAFTGHCKDPFATTVLLENASLSLNFGLILSFTGPIGKTGIDPF